MQIIIKWLLIGGGIIFWFYTLGWGLVYTLEWIRNLWDKYKWNTWLYQCKETFNAWYRWRFKKRSFSHIKQWNFVENLHKGFSGKFIAYGRDYRKHLFKKWWYDLLSEMLNSEEYKKYRSDQGLDDFEKAEV